MIKLLVTLISVDILLTNFYGVLPMEIWDAYSTSLLLKAVMWVGVVWWLVPYKYLSAKAVLAVFFLSQIVNLIEYHVSATASIWLLSISFCIFLVMVAFSLFRRYRLDSDVITDEYVYIIAKRPDRFTGFLASLWKQPFGRYAYYIDDAVFHYHHGKFKMTTACNYPMIDATVIKTNTKATKAVREQLARMLGSRWTLWHNCLTVRLKNVYDR